MTPDRYTAAEIKIVEHVRRNPAMSFDVSGDHPDLATRRGPPSRQTPRTSLPVR
ncbi:hypothetical protein [Streptomyces sp. NPDC101165]|uniref:hypothetical protein n=1 Tax=Streptomyces sp. NPDC101165 TaxID=3366119 RepID=UPI0038192ABC